jgi:hypothetical protein
VKSNCDASRIGIGVCVCNLGEAGGGREAHGYRCGGVVEVRCCCKGWGCGAGCKGSGQEMSFRMGCSISAANVRSGKSMVTIGMHNGGTRESIKQGENKVETTYQV